MNGYNKGPPLLKCISIFGSKNLYCYRKSQRNKLKSLLHYFEWLDKNSDEGSIKLSRQVRYYEIDTSKT